MFGGALSSLETPALGRVLRHTIVSALIAGAGAVVIALVLSAPYAALGIGVGVALAVVNLRFLDGAVAKVQTTGETNTKVVRKALGARSVSRLAIITGIAIGFMFLNGGLGIGMVVGLVVFQILFVVNVSRAILGSGVN